MRTCSICGKRFNERAYQVVVKPLGPFDSVECAEEAARQARREERNLASDLIAAARGRRVATEPTPDSPDLRTR